MSTSDIHPGHKMDRILLGIYLINATLLICHEIDSASRKEWELFHLPGGSDFFVAIHFALVSFLLWGLIPVARGHPAGKWCSLAVGLIGLTGGLIHACFLFTGDERFSSKFSSSLITAFILTSGLQLGIAIRWKAQSGEGNASVE